MYRDSQLGLCIDVSGPEGNAFALMGQAKNLSRQLGYSGDAITAEMMSGDYDNLLDVFEKYFGSVVTLINKPGEYEEEEDDEDC